MDSIKKTKSNKDQQMYSKGKYFIVTSTKINKIYFYNYKFLIKLEIISEHKERKIS